MRAPGWEYCCSSRKISPRSTVHVSRRSPFCSGIILFWDALGLGIRALTLSANTQTGEDEKLEGPALYITLGLPWPIGIGRLLPASRGCWRLAEHYLGWNPWLNNLLEGHCALVLLVGYIWAIGFMPDVKRLFGYHGAEHKTINAFESRRGAHTRKCCQVSARTCPLWDRVPADPVLISILVFTLLVPAHVLEAASRVLLIPVIAGIAVEYIRWTANHLDLPIVRFLIKPNLALQSLTTREPDRSMLEVAMNPLKP